MLTIKQHSILSGQTLIDFSCKCSLFLHRSSQYLKLCNQNCRALKSISHHLGKVPFKRLAWHHIGILWQREEQNPVLRGTFRLTALSVEPLLPAVFSPALSTPSVPTGYSFCRQRLLSARPEAALGPDLSLSLNK